MAQNSSIEWTESTWNPVAGCTKVSAGCKHCYAERMSRRLAAMARADRLAGRDPGRKLNYLQVVDNHGRWNGKLVLDRIAALRRVPAAVRFLSVEPLLGPIPRLPLGEMRWVIVGGESGPGARPMEPAWVRQLRDRCIAQGMPFFFKQWGGVNKAETGRMLDGRTWDEMPGRQELRNHGIPWCASASAYAPDSCTPCPAVVTLTGCS